MVKTNHDDWSMVWTDLFWRQIKKTSKVNVKIKQQNRTDHIKVPNGNYHTFPFVVMFYTIQKLTFFHFEFVHFLVDTYIGHIRQATIYFQPCANTRVQYSFTYFHRKRKTLNLRTEAFCKVIKYGLFSILFVCLLN